MTKDEYEALPKTQKAIFKILFTGGYIPHETYEPP